MGCHAVNALIHLFLNYGFENEIYTPTPLMPLQGIPPTLFTSSVANVKIIGRHLSRKYKGAP